MPCNKPASQCTCGKLKLKPTKLKSNAKTKTKSKPKTKPSTKKRSRK